MKLKGRICLITGASQGLGAEIAAHFAAEGASLMLCARDEKAVKDVAAALQAKHGGKALAMRCDVGDPKSVDALVAEILKQFGRIDVLVNNAGIYGPMGAIDEVDWQEWTDAININLMGTVYPCRAVLSAMKAQKSGKIINLSGGGATNPLPGISAYAASKAASVRFTETLALEVKPFGVDVNAVAPGALATRMMDQLLEAKPAAAGDAFMTRMQKLKDSGGTPLSVGAKCCVWLASTASDGITGKLIAAQWDPYEEFPAHAADLDGGDIYALRRITPKDRGKSWGKD
jgi:NAD(P)-dependent dehydrogenase (short-subunit alcohol dehydrogenase family)